MTDGKHETKLNPEPPSYWKGGTAEMLASVFPMFHLTLEGLGEAMALLSKGPARKRPAAGYLS
jgi:hypothetical protein